MKLRLAILFGALVSLATAGCSVNVGMRKTKDLEEVEVRPAEANEKILLLAIDGMISLDPRGNFFSKEPSLVASVREQLDLARKDEDIKGVILRINSPGGSLGATQIIADEIQQYRADTGNPVLALFMEIAASGALYIGMTADQIVAYPSTVTGSMGVIFISPNFEGLGDKIGVQYRVVKTGARKDMGTPFRDWPSEERAMLEALAAEYNSQFKRVVFESRKSHGMTRESFETLTDARIVSAEQALKLRLIDAIGNMKSAIESVEKKVAGGRKMKLVAYTRYPDDVTTLYSRSMGVSAETTEVGAMAQGVVQAALQGASSTPMLSKGFYYLW